MTERGLPIVDGAPACPFVAFDDDRDERAASPDHRHRCYAEAQPAPRALAHQEAYCLSSAFPVCPTFQDWARREAAHSRTEPPRPPAMDSVAAAATAPQPQRNPPRNWAEPPPWMSRDARRNPELWDEAAAEDEGAEDLAGASGAPQPGRGLSGSFADRVATDGGTSTPAAPPPASSAYEPGYDAPPARRAVPPPVPAQPQPSHADDDWDDEPDEADEEEPPEPPVRRRRERDPDTMAGLSGGGPPRRGRGGEPPRERRRESRAPEWERARAEEAFPTLRSRRLSEFSVPPLLVAVVALALAAAVLFALPGLLGFGNPSTGGGSGSPTMPLITPIVTPAPTPVPAPTDQLYVVQQGDTMSRIATRFEIPLGDLIAANAETIPDPNKLQIGDTVIIPARNPSELPAASEIPGAT